MENLTAEKFREALSNNANAKLIDVRTESEFTEFHIEGAELIDIYSPDFADKIKALPKDKDYYVYCRSGGRSASACGFMESLGYKTHNLAGGIVSYH
jgi:rhodanese-related sulfurtransferase